MNALRIGFSKEIELPRGGFLYIDDELPDLPPRARVFDPATHSFNPLSGITYRSARELAEVLYTTTPQGENTLTVRNGKRALLPALLDGGRFDKIEDDSEEVMAFKNDLLRSPVLRHVLCQPKNQFSFNPNSKIFARINRAELGEFDALVLGLILINHYKGQLVIPDFGFYGRDAHASLVRTERLIAGVYHLAELPLRLRNVMLLIQDKQASGALYDDAVLLARFAGLTPGTNAFNDYVEGAIALR